MPRFKRSSIRLDAQEPHIQTKTAKDSMMESETNPQSYWVGIDWGGKNHLVSVVDQQRAEIRKFSVPATLEGLQQIEQTLQAVGPVAGVAIEATHNPVFFFLLDKGYTVYPINPKVSKQWREGTSVAGVKSDVRDAQVLAAELARRHETLRAYQKPDSATAELGGLCEKQRMLIDQRTALVQQIRESLGVYYRAALDFFDDFTSPVAWAFLKRFPNPKALGQTRKDTLLKFLRVHRIGLKPVWLERIERRLQATAWPTPPAALAEEMLVLACVTQLQGLQPSLDKLEKRIAECAEPLPETRLMRSLPGAGSRLAPALAAIVRETKDDSHDIQPMRCLSGVAPVQDQSGKRCRTRIRRRCNKHWRNVLHLFAWCSTRACEWARAFYDLSKERGDSHATALRKLADKWLRIIRQMVHSNQPYDEVRYLAALQKNNSPVCARLGGKAGG